MIDLRKLPDPLPIKPLTRPFDVTITPPGSKSITCRAYVLAALAEGESKIIRPLRADDTEHLLEALCTLGAEARWVPGESGDGSEDVLIKGVAGRFPRGGHLYLGDGGTPTRFMIACACLAAEPVVIDASPRMRERPIAEGVEMLRQLGARIVYLEEDGRLPVGVSPTGKFTGGELTIDSVSSSQFISALILIAPCLSRPTVLRYSRRLTSASYVMLTAKMLQCWTRALEIPSLLQMKERTSPSSHTIHPTHVKAQNYVVEPDASSAAYWFAAAALMYSARTSVPRLNWLPHFALQPDMAILDQLRKMGAEVCDTPGIDSMHVFVRGCSALHASRLDARDCPDASVLLGAIASAARSCSMFTGLHTLRVKETDRIAALATELRKLGCTVEAGEDWIEITPPTEVDRANRAATVRERESRPNHEPAPILHGRGSVESGAITHRSEGGATGPEPVIIETYNDHRMAMSFAVLGLARPGIAIRNPACVSKSYPTFWDDFLKLYPQNPDEQPRELLDAMIS